jgi:hypothetical protein
VSRGTVRFVALPRLRQVAFVAADLEAVAAQLQEALGLDEPYRDKGVALFGLRNVVFAVGDTFLEVVSPTRSNTAAGRYLERQGGDSGYMAMVQLGDATAARRRLERLGVRVVWEFAPDSGAEPDIIDLHLHPRDVPGTLLALDQATPTGSWRWGGPSWTAAVPAFRPGGLRDMTIAVGEPAAAARRWAEVLDVRADDRSVHLADSVVSFVEPHGRDGIVALTIALPDETPDSVETETLPIAGVTLDLTAG